MFHIEICDRIAAASQAPGWAEMQIIMTKMRWFLLFSLLLIGFEAGCDKDHKTNTPLVNEPSVNRLIREGNSLADRQDYSHALDKYYEALKLDPNCFLCYYNLAKVYCDLRDYGSCVSCLEATIRLKPEWSLPYETLGDLYLKSKAYFPNRLNRAAENYKKAIELEPAKLELHFKLAKCYEDRGEEKNAEKEYETILKSDPANSIAASSLQKLKNNVGSK